MKKVQTKNKTKGLFGIFATLALAVGVGVSLAPREVVKTEAAETTYTHTFTAKTFDANNQTKKLSNVDWLVVNNGGYYGYDPTKGQQFGSGGNPAKSLTLSSTGFPGTIKTVKVSTAGAKDVDADVLVKVGSTSYGSAETISDSNTEYVFTGTSSGKLEIVWEQTSSKALYVKTIIVVYEEPEPKVLESIVVTTQPTKKNYYVGDTFDKTGMVVTAYYDDETDEEVSNDDVTVTPNIMALDVTSVEVDYEGEKRQSVVFRLNQHQL